MLCHILAILFIRVKLLSAKVPFLLILDDVSFELIKSVWHVICTEFHLPLLQTNRPTLYMNYRLSLLLYSGT